MKYFVFYTYGSCQTGDRNAGIAEFDNLDDAKKEIKEIKEEHPDCQIILIEGTEVHRQ